MIFQINAIELALNLILFSELLSSTVVYMTQQYIIREGAERLNKDLKNRPTEKQVWPYQTVRAKNYLRLNDPQLCTEFFTFENRFMDFQRYHKILDKAINKLGRFLSIF